LGGADYLVYVNKGRLFAIPFDLEKLETRGTAVPVLDDVAYTSRLGIGQLGFSAAPSGHGTAVYRAGGSEFEVTTLERVDPSGTREPLRNPPGRYDNPGLSPDGKRIALQVNLADVWVYDSQRDTMTRLTFGGVVYDHPIWSPDGPLRRFRVLWQGHVRGPRGRRQPDAGADREKREQDLQTSHCDGQSRLPMFPRTAEMPPPLVCLHCGATQATVRRDRQILNARLGYPADCVCCYCETGNACPRWRPASSCRRIRFEIVASYIPAQNNTALPFSLGHNVGEHL
jgi:hypothetical protein